MFSICSNVLFTFNEQNIHKYLRTLICSEFSEKIFFRASESATASLSRSWPLDVTTSHYKAGPMQRCGKLESLNDGEKTNLIPIDWRVSAELPGRPRLRSRWRHRRYTFVGFPENRIVIWIWCCDVSLMNNELHLVRTWKWHTSCWINSNAFGNWSGRPATSKTSPFFAADLRGTVW